MQSEITKTSRALGFSISLTAENVWCHRGVLPCSGWTSERDGSCNVPVPSIYLEGIHRSGDAAYSFTTGRALATPEFWLLGKKGYSTHCVCGVCGYKGFNQWPTGRGYDCRVIGSLVHAVNDMVSNRVTEMRDSGPLWRKLTDIRRNSDTAVKTDWSNLVLLQSNYLDKA